MIDNRKSNGVISSEQISRTVYRQLDLLCSLTQEEIEKLYQKDCVSGKSILEELNDLYDELCDILKISEDTVEENLLDKILGDSETDEFEIDEKTKERVNYVINKFNRITNDKISKSDKDEILSAINKYKGESNIKDNIYQFLLNLKNNVKYYIDIYDNDANVIMLATKGKKRRSRIYPSKETRNEVFLGTVNLVKIYSSIYYKKLQGSVEYDEIFQTASEALLSASYYYIPTGVAKFTTYASRCIENKLRREFFKRKKKKKSYEQEKDDIQYATMYADSLLRKSENYGRVYYNFNKPGTIIKRLNQKIREYNSDVLNLGHSDKARKIVRQPKGTEQTLEDIFEIMLNLVEVRKINLIISDAERDMFNTIAEYLGISGDEKVAYCLAQYLNLYHQKLKDIELYIEVEQDLQRKNDGFVPSQQEILDEMNKRVKQFNKDVYHYRYDGENSLQNLYGGCGYTQRKSYLKAYEEEFGINFFADKDDDNSRQSEKNSINEVLEDVLFYYDGIIDELEEIYDRDKEQRVSYSCTTEELDGVIVERIEFEPTNGNDEETILVSDAIELIKNKIEQLASSFLKDELKRRKNIVSEALTLYNSKIFEENNSKISQVEALRANSYKRKYPANYISGLETDVQLLYFSDEEFMEFIEYQSRSRSPRQSVEEEVCTREFMGIYYKALSGLPPIQNEILLRWYDSEGNRANQAREIAEELGIQPSEVIKEKRKAIGQLRKNPAIRNYRDNN